MNRDLTESLISALLLTFFAALVAISQDLIGRNFLYLATLLTAYLLFKYPGARSPLRHPACLMGLAFITYLACSAFWGAGDVMPYIRWGCGLSFFWIAVILVCQTGTRTRLIRFATALQLIVIVASLYATVHYFASPGEPFRNIGPGILHHPIMGPSIVIAVGAAGVMMRGLLDEENIGLTILLIASVTAYTFTTDSRGPLLADAAWIGALLILQKKHLKYTLTVIGGLLAGLAALLAVEPGYYQTLVARGDTYRFAIWQQTLPELAKHPVFGWGIDFQFLNTSAAQKLWPITHLRIEHPHNLALSTIFYSGLIGLVLLFATTAFGLYYINRYRRQSFIHYAPMVLAIFCLSLTDLSRLLDSPSPIWFIYWLPTALLTGMAIRFSTRGDTHGR